MKQGTSAFFNKVKAEVKKLSLSDVISEYIEVKVTGYANNDALCPFHGDEKFGNFKIHDEKNLYKCFSCDETGDGINFVREIENIGFKEAVIKLAYTHNIISKKQSEELLGGVMTNSEIKQIKKKKKEKSDDIAPKGDNEILDAGFRALMSVSTLSEEHKTALLERGMTEEMIKRGEYFTFPKVTNELLKEMYVHLKETGSCSQILKQVPGFVTAEHLKQVQGNEVRYLYTFTNQNGLGIPIRNASGQIVGMQVRKDKVEGDIKRYGWFSSSYASNKNVYKHGTEAGAPIHVSYPEENKFKNVVFITEGVFKSESIANHFKATTLSVQGVGNYKAILEDLELIREQQGDIEHIYIAFDADMAHNVNVYNHLKKMVELIKSEFPETKIYNSLWDEKFGKGIDDLIQEGNVNKLKRVSVESFIEKYDIIIEKLIEEHQEKIVKVKKHFIKEAFVADVYTPLMKKAN
ncbi:CHC2 zinc finger domain-containing protein [Rossellomorea marisflavi]|uniref:CHC2 zinc finger domain-containing protein n=1 Tax=Rossellomorea marisflavi TaxID=189381 RepID=UPI003F9F4F13